MKCRACDCVLTDFEATRKAKQSMQYVDLCERCFDTIRDEFEVIEREDLKPRKKFEWDIEDENPYD